MKSLLQWIILALIWTALPTSISLSVYYPNIAINQSTEQSSTALDGDSNHGVDAGLGIKFEWKKCVRTQVEDNPWWKVDLGGIYQIEAATITNTYESCCNDKLQQVDLTVAFYEDDPIDAQQVCHQKLTYLSRGRVTVRCDQLPFGRYFFVSIPKTQWEMSFCEVEVYPKIPHSLGNEGLLFYKQTSRWQDSEWVAVENFRLYMYMEVTLTSGTVLETFDQPRDIYPNYPVRVGALQINDTVLAPFSSNYSLGKVTAVKDWLTGRYEIQPDSGGAARNFSHADLRHQDACKLQIVCPPNSECTREYMNDKFPTFYYICKCRKGFLSSRGTFMAVLNNDILDVCKGGINLSEGKPTNQSSTSGDAVSSRAVDGNLNPLFSIGQSCSSTTSQANAWWRLDLEEVVYVAHIFIQFRSRCCDSQATHFLIYAGPHLEDNFPVPGQDFLNYLCSNFTVANIPDHKGWHVHCGRTITARYLYIRLWETNNLTLCEVYVYDDSNGMYCKNPW